MLISETTKLQVDNISETKMQEQNFDENIVRITAPLSDNRS